MSDGKSLQKMQLEEIEAFQHADDDYWYRPLVISENLFTYVAHVPPGGEMPAHEDAHEFDTSLYMLAGSLEITFGEEQHVVDANAALYVPGGVPFGVRNDGEITASFVLTFHPPPDIESVEALKETYEQKGREYKSPDEINQIVGDTLNKCVC